jgi:hypothetical protein
MRARNPRLLAETVLYILYLEAISDGGKLDQSTIKGRFPGVGITDTLLTFAINDLRQRQFVDNEYSTVGIEHFTISRNGYDYVRYRLTLTGSAIRDFSKSYEWILDEEVPGDDSPIDNNITNPGFIPGTIGDISDDLADVVDLYEELNDLEGSSIPASNRTVTIDHNGDPYKEAISALEAVLQEFRKDHKSSINHFDIEDRVLFKVLEAGRTLLDETEVYLETAENYLIRPLRRIIERYDQAIVGILVVEHGSEMLTAAKTALDAVLKLLGLG